jgi:DNA sulfur modification protein DndD
MASLEVRILSMHWKNIRAMMDMDAPAKNGEKYCDFPEKRGYVILMPNTSGKTTTLNLLEHVITGVAPSVEEASEYRRAVGDDGSGGFIDSPSTFITRFLINGEKWGIELVMSHRNGEVSFNTHTPNQGKRDGWHMPLAFRQAFHRKRRLAKLVAFDAETARGIIRKTDKELLRDAIRQFGGYAEVHRLVGSPTTSGIYSGGRFDEVKSEIEGTMGKAKGDKDITPKLKRARSSRDKAKKIRDQLTAMIEDDEKRMSELDEEISELNGKIDSEWGDIEGALSEVTDLKDQLSEAKLVRSDQTEGLLGTLINPQNVLVNSWDDFVSFHKTHRDQKLPEQVGRGWIEETAQGEVCICGRKIDGDIREHMLAHIQDHLDGMKLVAVSAVQGAFSESPNPDTTAVEYANSKLADTEGIIDDLTQAIEVSISEGATEEAKDEMSRLNETISTLKDERSDVEHGHRIRTTKDYVWLRGVGQAHGFRKNSAVISEDQDDIDRIENVNIADLAVTHFEEKLAEMSDVGMELKGLNLTRKIIGQALDQLNGLLRDHVSDRAAAMWKTLPPAKRDKGVTMTLGDDGLRFWRGDDPQKKVSGAQGVTACYAATTAICRLGSYSVPLVADTPLSGWDNDVLPAFEETITSMFDQWMGLCNKTEAENFLRHVWKEKFPPSETYIATMVENEGESEEDGGRMLRYSEDPAVFKKLAGVGI